MTADRRDAADVPDWLTHLRSADSLFVTDERQRVVLWSGSAERTFGYTAAEVLGRPCYEVVAGLNVTGHPVCRQDCQVTTNARRGRVTACYDVLARRRDGSRVWLNNSILLAPATPGAGNGTGTYLIHLARELDHAPAPSGTRALAHAAEARADAPATGDERLSRREIEVLRLLADGRTTAEIAAALTVSPFTARNHISSIQRKLGARNRVETVLRAAARGLI
jgi:PAS domain S-box-containing protein